MNHTDYVTEANRQLSDKESYLKVDSDLNPKIAKEIKEFVTLIKHLIPTQLFEFLIIKHWRTPIFYLLPKIHKPGNPGRPIVSQIDSPTSRLPKFVDHYLKPFIQDIPSYIKDTTDFLNKLDSLGRIPQNITSNGGRFIFIHIYSTQGRYISSKSKTRYP